MTWRRVEHYGNRGQRREVTWRRGLTLWKQMPREGKLLGEGV
jgi:hypothetical protein